MNKLTGYISLALILVSGKSFSQNSKSIKLSEFIGADSVTYTREVDQFGNFPKEAKALLDQFSINGYYRFVGNYRALSKAYEVNKNNPNNLFIGDDSQIPQLMMNISGSVAPNTSFGTDLFIWSPMTGMGQAENVKGLNLGISLYGSYASSLGDFNIRAGGINWYALSAMTFQANKGYNRYSIFERNPWDPNTKNIEDRYTTFYNSGAINQDERWGQQAFQGLIVEGARMPHGLSGSFMYGKTQLNGGLSPLPNNSVGGKLRKDYGMNFISLNTFNNISFKDSSQKDRIGFNIATLEFKNIFGAYTINGEIGMGRYFVQNSNQPWGEAISIKVARDLFAKFPTEIHLYRISPHVINNSATFINSSIDVSVLSNASSVQPVLPAVASGMMPIGQLINNRQGIDLNAQINIGRLKSSIGWSVSSELQSVSSKITYSHPINSLALAHFWRWDFPSNVGPYNNLSKIYRTVYETLELTDVDPISKLPTFKKHFNAIEWNAKYQNRIFNKPCYFFYLGQFSSAQTNFSPITVFSEKALLRTYYHQLEGYMKVSNNLVWSNYLGFERILANYQSKTDDVSARPKNQTGYSIATGLDIRMSKGAGLYLRQRWMNYKDANFSKDAYQGFETTVEIKIFF